MLPRCMAYDYVISLMYTRSLRPKSNQLIRLFQFTRTYTHTYLLTYLLASKVLVLQQLLPCHHADNG